MSSLSKRVIAGAAILACALTSQAFAADRGAVPAGGRSDPGAVQAQRAALLSAGRKAPATATANSAASAASAAATVSPNELVANSYRAYPASCFSDFLPNPSNAIQPLPVSPSGVLYSRTVTLYERGANNTDSAEDVTITVFRVACSSSGDKLPYNTDGFPVSATLVRIQRQAAYEGDNQLYPQYPDIRVAQPQNGIQFDNKNLTDFVRTAVEPNTVLSDTMVGAPIINSTTYVLENYANPSFGFFDFNQSFQIRFDNGYQNGRTIINVDAYVPSQQTYPAAFLPMPINGYLTGSWYDPTHGGEGLLTQVLDSNSTTRTFFASWYTYDQNGIPFWLAIQADFPIGSTQLLNVPVYYATGGGFAGNFTKTTRNNWGTMNVQFPDCNTIKFDYSGATPTVTGGPGGTGTGKIWKRLGSINSLACQ